MRHDVVPHDDVSSPQFRHQHPLHIAFQHCAINRALDHHRSAYARERQRDNDPMVRPCLEPFDDFGPLAARSPGVSPTDRQPDAEFVQEAELGAGSLS
jgi:hypothetical protein